MPEPEPEPEPDAKPEAETPKDPAVELPLERDIKPAEPTEADDPQLPATRRGVLPPPKSEGKRVQPLTTRGQRSDDAPKRPSASGLPSGMRAPGVPNETEAENTDILIASAVAALTEGDPAEHSSMALSAEPLAPTSATSATSQPLPGLPPPEPAPDERKRPAFLWFGVAALAAVAIGALVVSAGKDDEPAPTSASAVVAPTGSVPQRESGPGVNPGLESGDPLSVAAPPAGDAAELAVADIPSDVGEPWVELDDTVDVGDAPALAEAVDIGSVATGEPEPPDDGTPDATGEGSRPKGSRGGKRRRNKAKETTDSSPRPAPAAPSKQPQDAASLLADARKALASGQARRAYSLASKSRSAKRTSAALVVMAKAACRFGGASQAKSAFNQLSVSNRRGLRAECRTHGVRLGI